MSTRKRLFSFLLALLMVMSLLPLDLAYAEDGRSDQDTAPYTEDQATEGTIAPVGTRPPRRRTPMSL